MFQTSLQIRIYYNPSTVNGVTDDTTIFMKVKKDENKQKFINNLFFLEMISDNDNVYFHNIDPKLRRHNSGVTSMLIFTILSQISVHLLRTFYISNSDI